VARLPHGRRQRGRGHEGGCPHPQAGRSGAEYWQGLGGEHIRADAQTSRRHLGRDRLDLYYAHIDDRNTPLEETVDALAELAESWAVGLLGCSNTALWRIERARGIARAAGRPAYSCIQQRHSYLLPLPRPRQSNLITEELIDYAEAENLALLAYSPLLGGLYPRGERPSGEYAHANDERLAVLGEVARELNATTSQVVLAWLLASTSVIPIIGASSVAQLDELLGALDVPWTRRRWPAWTRPAGAGRNSRDADRRWPGQSWCGGGSGRPMWRSCWASRWWSGSRFVAVGRLVVVINTFALALRTGRPPARSLLGRAFSVGPPPNPALPAFRGTGLSSAHRGAV
jgi:aryl-alcohol dehydrogenase-like predicted oxidoreductase